MGSSCKVGCEELCGRENDFMAVCTDCGKLYDAYCWELPSNFERKCDCGGELTQFVWEPGIILSLNQPCKTTVREKSAQCPDMAGTESNALREKGS